MSNKRDRTSLRKSLLALKNTIQGANRLVPGCIIIGLLLAAIIAFVSFRFTDLMMGAIVIVVLFSSILIYSRTSNYGEAALALVAGLLTAFTVEWNPGRFTVFLFSWVGLTLVVFLISSIRLAADVEEIYSDAALALNSNRYKRLIKQLRSVEKEVDTEMLGPRERAEVIRLFSFRKLPLECVFRTIPSTDSDEIRPLIPAQTVHRFRYKSSTDSSIFRPLRLGHSESKVSIYG